MTTHTPRSFEVPAALVAAGHSPLVDLDVLDREVEFPGEFGEWAEKVLVRENTKTLDDVCGNMRLLPRGVLGSVQLDDDSLLISGLVDSDGRVWDTASNTWTEPEDEIDIVDGTVILEDDEVAFVARALREGADEVWFRPYIPKAFVSAVVAAPETPAEAPQTEQTIPEGSAIVAVVDPIDEDAVLEMLAITPGPRVLRRHDGQWFEDPEWIPVLKSVKPPTIVKLTETQVASVSAQVDKSTGEQEWEPFEADNREQYQIFTASAGQSSYIQELQRESDETALFALVAVAGRKLTPKDAIATERLKRYWTVGKGAAKIRWGTPGSWRRCYRHLVKYVGPKIAPGYCTNLSQRLGGHGIATHVTSSAEAVTAANPSGVNGYDRGMTFEESTGGVERDYFGRFAPESGSSRSKRRSERAKRRKSSMARSKKERDEKAAKKGAGKKSTAEAEAKKAATEAKRAREAAQREQLAAMSVRIAEARAAGEDIRAAELRVEYAELSLRFADTTTQKLNAQAALTNAKTSLARTRRAKREREAREARRSLTNPPDPTGGLYDRVKKRADERERQSG